MSVVKCEVCVLVWGRGGPGFRVCVISAGVLLMAGQDRLWRKPGSSFVWESLLLRSLPLSLSLSLRSVHPLGISSSSLTVRVGFSTLYSLTFFLSLFPSLFLGIWSRFTFLVGSFSDSHLSCAIEGSSECLESFDLFSWLVEVLFFTSVRNGVLKWSEVIVAELSTASWQTENNHLYMLDRSWQFTWVAKGY